MLVTCSLMLGACAAYPTVNLTVSLPPVPDIVVDVRSPDLAQFAWMWKEEVRRKYGTAIILMSHGTDVLGGWWCQNGRGGLMPIELAVEQLRGLYPVRRIVLVVCNPGGYDLHIPNVSHSMSDVWVVPDRNLTPRSLIEPDVVGSIYEFDED